MDRSLRGGTSSVTGLEQMPKTEQKWEARHKEDKVSGLGVPNMFAKLVKEVAPGQEAREKERSETARMVSGGLEASQHADTLQEGGPARTRDVPTAAAATKAQMAA
jgi:hypothetical protein